MSSHGGRKILGNMEEGLSQGMKVNGLRHVPVTEQGDELSFYKPNRNEPVPPDPYIISAVKISAVAPPPYPVRKDLYPVKPQESVPPKLTKFLKGATFISEIPRPAFTSDGSASVKKSQELSNSTSETGQEGCVGGNLCTPVAAETLTEKIGPRIFLASLSADEFCEVKIVKQVLKDEFIVLRECWKARDQLIELEKAMYRWYLANCDSLDIISPKVGYYYALKSPTSVCKICFRVQIMTIEDDSKCCVYLLDHGERHVVASQSLFPLRQEWSKLDQLTAQIRVNIDFQEAAKNKVISIRPTLKSEMNKTKVQQHHIPGAEPVEISVYEVTPATVVGGY